MMLELERRKALMNSRILLIEVVGGSFGGTLFKSIMKSVPDLILILPSQKRYQNIKFLVTATFAIQTSLFLPPLPLP